MSKKVTFRRDAQGIAAFLRSPKVRTLVNDAAHRVAAGVDKPAKEVVVSEYTTDRAAAAVTVKDGRAKLWHIKDGMLTRALAAAGLEWGSSPNRKIKYRTRDGREIMATEAQIRNWTRGRG